MKSKINPNQWIIIGISILILLFMSAFTGCVVEPVVDEEMLLDLKNNTWVKAEFGVFYLDNCIKTSIRSFNGNLYTAITKYNFENQFDVDVTATYEILFDTSEKPYKMKAIIQDILVNDVSVAGEEEYEFGGTTRDFPEAGTEVYYIFSVQAKKILLLEGSYTDFPKVFSLNYSYYLKQPEETEPISIAYTTWQRVSYIDELFGHDLGENCIEYKLRSFTDDIMKIYAEYNFDRSPDLNLLYTYEYEIVEGPDEEPPDPEEDPEVQSFMEDARYIDCKLISVFYNDEELTGKTNYAFGQTTVDFGFAGDVLYSSFIHYGDIFAINDNLIINDPGNEPITDPVIDPGENPGYGDEDPPDDSVDRNFYPTGLGNALYTIQEDQSSGE